MQSTSNDVHTLILITDAGHCILGRYHRTQDIRDLDQSIKYFERSCDLCPVDHPCRPAALVNLAMGKFISCQVNGTYLDLDLPISLFHNALDLCSIGHPDRPSTQLHLAIALLSRFAKRGFQADADVAVMLFREALDLSPVGHPGRSMSQHHLATTLWTRFEQRVNHQDLEEAITLHREALDLRPVGHPDRSTSLDSLAITLHTRFKYESNDHDLDEAIMLHREAVNLRPLCHPDRRQSLNNLANALNIRFKHLGNDKDISEAITLQGQALGLWPVGHHDRGMSLNNLANALINRFDKRGNHQDLDKAITLHRDALDSTPVGHPRRSGSLNHLTCALSTRFDQRGDDKDIDEAIVFGREALHLTPNGIWSRDSLARALGIRFRQRGNGRDIDEAIMLHREALDRVPRGHHDRHEYLSSLANTVNIRLEYHGNDKDIDEIIAVYMEALDLMPDSHPEKFVSLSNLATQLSNRFKRRGDENDLKKAMLLHVKAMDLVPVGHPARFDVLNNLADVLMNRFMHEGDVHDLYGALTNARSALSLLTTSDPHQLFAHRTLATTYLLFHQSGLHPSGTGVDSLSAAMGHLKAGADAVCGGLLSRLRISLDWITEANKYAHGTLLEAYATSMKLLDAYMSVTASVSSRRDAMKLFSRTLAVDAASCALQHGDECRAVELLEQGRTLIWNQMARFRTPLDGLQEHGDHARDLVKKFQEFSYLVDKPASECLQGTPRVKEEADVVRYMHLVDEWKKIVEEIRKLEGFSRFMLPPLFSDLQDAARDGPVVVLIASDSSCNAIIIRHRQSPINVPLLTNVTKLQQLVVTLRQTVQRDANAKEPQGKLITVLRELWVDVVWPVVQNLGESPSGSRIWWCPTSFFNFLPLHAAGEYRRGGTNLSTLYISSYTPSLTALIRARGKHDRSQHMPFAAIGQNHPPGYTFSLSSVEPELELVRSILPPAPTVSFTKITSIESTKYRALCTLRDNHWLHFACHGVQNLVEPFKSAFLMRDEPLTLLDITQMNLSRHEFAFLSACETAVGDFETPDEVIHLAAALQFAGVKSVIGTFWKVEDSTVRRLVEVFYKNLCRDGKMNPKRAARALHMAVQSLANDKDIPLDQRIVFMHVGI
ncbi:hypothetical protein M405DRAFT_742629 [Rhizopogon salebrosus TDB-379]|nr:hypothetical protein M405DRAFT_742629 [Rhizopogon salebrosus TDB-379]